MDINHDGYLNKQEFEILNNDNPLFQIIFDLFDEDGNGMVDFSMFVQRLYSLQASFGTMSYNRSSYKEMIQFVFRIYDIDGDGYLSQWDMDHFLAKSMWDAQQQKSEQINQNLTLDDVQYMVRRTFREMDKDENDKIGLIQFTKVINFNIQFFDFMTQENNYVNINSFLLRNLELKILIKMCQNRMKERWRIV